MANDPHFEVYPRQRERRDGETGLEPTGDFGWRFRAANGKISAIGGEGFTRREDAHRAALGFRKAVQTKPYGVGPVVIYVDQ